MSSSKNKLPESLELLLDTMCNTFGGIMFIAIALVIITQVSRKAIMNKAVPDVSPRRLEEMKAEIDELEKKCQEQELKNLKTMLERKKLTPQIREVILVILELWKKNDAVQRTLESLESSIENTHQAELELQRKTEDIQLKRQEMEARAKERLSEEQLKVARLQEQIKTQEKTREDLARRAQELRQQLKEVKPAQTITFSQEKESLLTQENFYLWKGEIYTDKTVDVQRNNILKLARVKPIAGRGMRCTESNLAQVFSDYSKNFNLIALWIDDMSFDAFVETRRYLREHNYVVFWSFNPEFSFSIGTGVRRGSN